MGRPKIFKVNSNPGDRVQGILTPKGSVQFEAARRRLAKLAAWEYEDVGDADVIEFLARGETATREHLERQERAAK